MVGVSLCDSIAASELFWSYPERQMWERKCPASPQVKTLDNVLVSPRENTAENDSEDLLQASGLVDDVWPLQNKK